MKKLWKILQILLAVAALFVLLLLGYVFVGTNLHYVADFRKAAGVPNTFDVTITQTSEGVRVELWSMETMLKIAEGQAAKYPFVVINQDRKVVRAGGCTPIDFDRRNLWGLWTYEDFLALYGEPHGEVPTSSGLYWPIWITDDGYMITFWNPGEKLWPTSIGNYGEVFFYDLLTTPE